MRQYVGIYIAKHTHVCASKFEDGQIHGKTFAFTNDDEGFRSLLSRFEELEATPESTLVVMESTGHYWIPLWEFLDAHGFEIAVVNPVLTDAFRKADTLRKTKTDQVDALLIAEFARFKRLGPSKVSPEETEGLKQLTRYRHHLVTERTSFKNMLTSIADRLFPELAGLFASNGSATAKAIMSRFGSAANVAASDIRTITKVISEASHGHYGREKATEIKEAARRSVGSTFASDALAFEASHIASFIDHITEEIDEIDSEIARIIDPKTNELLQSIPGIGPVCAATIAAEVGDPNRFATPGKLMAYSGIDATKHQSGKFDGDKQHMSKRGSAPLRDALMTAADRARMYDPYFGDYYDSLKTRGKHHFVAVSACARKLCGVILAVLKEQRPYEIRPSIQSQKEGQV